MKKMDFGETMEVVANLSVIAGLVFLGFQVRQNTAAVQAQTLQALVESSASFLENLARDSDTQRIVTTLASNPDEATAEERQRVALLIRAQFTRFQSAYLQWQKGSLSDAAWIAYTQVLCNDESNPWTRAGALSWPVLRASLTERFRDFVEKCQPEFAASVKAKESAPTPH
jgi:hypothetical protein